MPLSKSFRPVASAGAPLTNGRPRSSTRRSSGLYDSRTNHQSRRLAAYGGRADRVYDPDQEGDVSGRAARAPCSRRRARKRPDPDSGSLSARTLGMRSL